MKNPTLLVVSEVTEDGTFYLLICDSIDQAVECINRRLTDLNAGTEYQPLTKRMLRDIHLKSEYGESWTYVEQEDLEYHINRVEYRRWK